MFVKAFVGLALVIAPASDVSFVQYPQVRQVICDRSRGSAFQTTKGWVSVAHVTRLPGCTIDGLPITETESDDALDFSRFVTGAGRWLPARINCEGFKAGRYYYATGYALGRPYQTNVRIMATGWTHVSGMAILVGTHTVIPGMSGAAIFDEHGAAVGTVNAYQRSLGLSFSRALKDTSLCRDSASDPR